MNYINRFFSGCTRMLLLGSLVLLASCTGDYEEINTNTNAIPVVTPAELPFLFTKALSTAPNNQANYQVAQNLFADQYAQYFSCTAASFGSDRLAINQNWVGAAFNPIYTEVAPQLNLILEMSDPSSAEYALANIWWVYAFHRVTDYWGPIPYSEILKDLDVVPYTAQDKIYEDFFARLDDALAKLAGKTSEKPFGDFDILYKGDVPSWIRFGNTLRLRLAMRISNISPQRAEQEAEKAVAGGVMEISPTHDALVQRSVNGGDGNGLAIMQWNEFRMSASMESVLKGYEDPRIKVYYMPAKETGEYNGIRNGLTPGQMAEKANLPAVTSQQGPRWSPPDVGGISTYLSTPQNVMCAAEAWFLRAEGALKGWDMGSLQPVDYYNNGIRQSWLQWGITDNPAAYINDDGKKPVAPDDSLKTPPMTTIPVKFSTDAAVQAEQIATQKWLALFPDGVEAWADYRRSKLVKLYPVVNSDNPLITNTKTQWLRRIPFLTTEKQINAAGVQTGVDALSGADDTQTPLWWDTHPRD